MCAINYKSEVSHSMGETPQRWLVTSAAIVVDKVAMLHLHPPWKQCPARVDIESLRSEKWNENLIHSFREVKSEMKIWFTLFEKWKVKWKSDSLFSRSEIKIWFTLFEKWKVKWKCLEIEIQKWNFSRILENPKFLEKFWEIPENQKKKKVFKSRPYFFPPLAFECIKVLPPPSCKIDIFTVAFHAAYEPPQRIATIVIVPTLSFQIYKYKIIFDETQN